MQANRGSAFSVEVNKVGAKPWRDVFLVFRKGDFEHGAAVAFEKYRLETGNLSLFDDNTTIKFDRA